MQLKLPHQKSLNNKKFEEIPPKLQNRIEDCNLVLYIIDSKLPERDKLNIFERVNSGASLTRQEMRNRLYTGQATCWLKEEASTKEFADAIGKSLTPKEMREMKDRKLVNRFCAFTLVGVSEYEKDIDFFLAKSLQKMNGMKKVDLDDLSRRFRLGLQNNYTLFRSAFRKPSDDPQSTNPINTALWDVMTTGLAKIPHNVVVEKNSDFDKSFIGLLKNKDFSDAITKNIHSIVHVKRRFELADGMFKEVFGDYAN
ncbi:MAG: hypothetical protein NTW75_00160 [Planctomycetales bacterium]|nr:hypothetical protein [Planctomycetales bacterium]